MNSNVYGHVCPAPNADDIVRALQGLVDDEKALTGLARSHRNEIEQLRSEIETFEAQLTALMTRVDSHADIENEPARFRDGNTGAWSDVGDELAAIFPKTWRGDRDPETGARVWKQPGSVIR